MDSGPLCICFFRFAAKRKEKALRKAAKEGNVAIVQRLVEEGVHFDKGDKSGENALHLACKHGQLEALEMFLQNEGLSSAIRRKNKAGQTPLHLAIVNKNDEIALKLLECHAPLDITDHHDQTPLELVKEDQDELRKIILEQLHAGQKNGAVSTVSQHQGPMPCMAHTIDVVHEEDPEQTRSPASPDEKDTAKGKQPQCQSLSWQRTQGMCDAGGSTSGDHVPLTEENLQKLRDDNAVPAYKDESNMSATDCDEDSSVSSYSSGSDVIVDEYKWVRRQIRPLKKGAIFARRFRVYGERYNLRPNARFAKDLKTKEKVVLKFYSSPALFKKTEHMHQLLADAEYVCKMVVSFDTPSTGYPPCIVLEKAMDDLHGWMVRASPHFMDRRHLLHQITSGVQELHERSIVYGDFKISNVMFFESYRWKLADLDNAVFAGESTPIKAAVTYAAPEIIKACDDGQTEVTMHLTADLWSFGVLAYEVYSGRRFYGPGATAQTVRDCLFGGKPWQSLEYIEEKQGQRFVRRMLQMNPDERWTASRAMTNATFRTAQISSSDSDED